MSSQTNIQDKEVIDLTGDSPKAHHAAPLPSASSLFIPKNNISIHKQLQQQQPSNTYNPKSIQHDYQNNLIPQLQPIAPRDKHSTSKVKLVDPSAFIPTSQSSVARQPLAAAAANHSVNQLQRPMNNNSNHNQKPTSFTTAAQMAVRPQPPPIHIQQQFNHQRQQPTYPYQQFPSVPPISNRAYLNSSSPTRYAYQNNPNPSIAGVGNGDRLQGDPLADEPEPNEWTPSARTDLATTTKSLRELVFETVDLDELDLNKANIEGTKFTLLPHQIIGVGWAVNREKGPNKGGLLADDMGLGKTVQMIGLIVQNHPKNPDSTILKIVTPKASKSKSKLKSKSKEKEKEKAVENDQDEEEDEPTKTKIKSHTTLILAPLAVVNQWAEEIRSKTNGLSVMIHHDKTKAKNASDFKRYDVVVTSYTTAAAEWKHTKEGKESSSKKEAKKKAKKGVTGEVGTSKKNDDDDSDALSDSDSDDTIALKKKVASKSKKPSLAPLFDADWLRIIADEAQNIKNKDTNAAQACFLLSKKAVSRWCLTGTPIQNGAMELFSLIHFMRMPPFNDFQHFKEKIADPLASSNATRSNWGMKRLHFVLETFMLRRPKTAEVNGKPVITLPKRNVDVVSLEFDDPSEREFYESLEELIKSNIEKASEKSESGKINHIMVLTGLMRLRQACNHPSLCSKLVLEDISAMKAQAKESETPSDGVSPSNSQNLKDQAEAEKDDSADELADLFSKVTVERKCKNCEEILDSEIPKDQSICRNCDKIEREIMQKGIDWFNPEKSSTKIRAILKILNGVKEKGEGEKTIVFSQFTSFLNLLEPFLKAEKLKFVRYDGTMRNQEREVVLERIRQSSSTNIILISFKAGSTGLNLTCCNHVILSDLWWNPQIEEQAFDRAHRFGQKRDVFIHKLSLVDTVEERILALQEKKRALSKAALEGTKLKKSKDEKADMRFLMGMFGAEI